MKYAGKFLLLLCLSWLVPATFAHAREIVAEQRFVSQPGSPEAQQLRFSGAGFADFLLRVHNGQADGSQRVSSVLIDLNGAKVLTPADFNQKVATVERVIAPAEGDNVLAVDLRSNPGGSLLVQILGAPTFNLPPDPGEAGDATLEGVDANANGIRDDIERWIYLTYPRSEKLRMALIQEYYTIQNMIIHGHQQNRDAVYDDMDAMMRAGECMNYVHPERAYKISEELEARIVNTSERTYAYLEASRILGGGTFRSRHPKRWKESCTFNPDIMSN